MKQKSKTGVLTLIVFWLYVALPLLWGVASTLKKAMALFN
ncbi:MFS transporter small subunit [Methylomonas subterranea]